MFAIATKATGSSDEAFPRQQVRAFDPRVALLARRRSALVVAGIGGAATIERTAFDRPLSCGAERANEEDPVLPLARSENEVGVEGGGGNGEAEGDALDAGEGGAEGELLELLEQEPETFEYHKRLGRYLGGFAGRNGQWQAYFALCERRAALDFLPKTALRRGAAGRRRDHGDGAVFRRTFADRFPEGDR